MINIEDCCFIDINTDKNAPVVMDCGEMGSISNCLFSNNVGNAVGAIQAKNVNIEYVCIHNCIASQIGDYDVEAFVLNLYSDDKSLTVKSTTICYCKLELTKDGKISTAIKNTETVDYSGMNISQNYGNAIFSVGQNGDTATFTYSSFIQNSGNRFIVTFPDPKKNEANSMNIKYEECNFIDNEIEKQVI